MILTDNNNIEEVERNVKNFVIFNDQLVSSIPKFARFYVLQKILNQLSLPSCCYDLSDAVCPLWTLCHKKPNKPTNCYEH